MGELGIPGIIVAKSFIENINLEGTTQIAGGYSYALALFGELRKTKEKN